jgi:hypothetical protein
LTGLHEWLRSCTDSKSSLVAVATVVWQIEQSDWYEPSGLALRGKFGLYWWTMDAPLPKSRYLVITEGNYYRKCGLSNIDHLEGFFLATSASGGFLDPTTPKAPPGGLPDEAFRATRALAARSASL